MKCPQCHRTTANDDGPRVTDSRRSGDTAIRRRRKCSCGHRFSTYEIIVTVDSTRQPVIADLARLSQSVVDLSVQLRDRGEALKTELAAYVTPASEDK